MNIPFKHKEIKTAPIEGSLCSIRLGGVCTGKSLDQTETDVLDHLLAGEEVWCCYWLNWNKPNYHYFKPTKRDFLEKVVQQRNCVVVFDELAQIFEPRDWQEEGGEIRRWFQLHRHFHVDIYANTQDISLVAKSIGIIANDWQLLESVDDPWLIKWVLKQFHIERIGIRKDWLTYQELKKMANGWELGEDVGLDNDWVIRKYRKDKLIHKELDDYKVELVHRYCPACAQRQGESQILKEDTTKIAELGTDGIWRLKEPEYCPKHPGQLLELRESGLYDTDYDPETDTQEIEWVPMIDSPKGYTRIRYKGLISPEQSEERLKLNQKTKGLKPNNDGIKKYPTTTSCGRV